MDAALIGNVILGLLLAIGALGSRLSASSRKQAKELRITRTEVEQLYAYVHLLRKTMAAQGIEIPDWPSPLMKPIEEE